jgi:hypothetical protein
MAINWNEAFNRLFEIINAGENRQAPNILVEQDFLEP